jgi:DNA polymerase-3 subunit alpha
VESRAQAGGRLKLAGTVVAVKERSTRTGSRMAWVRLSDASGSCEVTVFSEVLGRARELIAPGTSVVVTADAQTQGETLRLTALEIAPLDKAAAGAGAGLRVWLGETEAVPHIRDLLRREGGGKGQVILVPQIGEAQRVEIAVPGSFNVTPRLTQALMAVAGVRRVEEV